MRSLSNLYKQWFVRTETQNTRVINSDAIVTELLGKSAPSVQNAETAGNVAESGEDVFTEGLAAPEVDYLQTAKEEADRILAEARKEAERIIVRAEAEKSEIQKNAQEKGYQDGQEQVQQELSRLRGELESSYQAKWSELDAQYAQKRADMEKDLVDVILEVFNKVFHIQFDNKKDILLYLIDNAILNIEGEKKFRIKVAESNVLFLENKKEEILEHVGHDIELEILTDSTMDGNNCIIETDSGVFDCSLGVQLENLIKDIRSLCS